MLFVGRLLVCDDGRYGWGSVCILFAGGDSASVGKGHLRGDDALSTGLVCGGRIFENGDARDSFESVCVLFAGGAGDLVGAARLSDGDDLSGCEWCREPGAAVSAWLLFAGGAGDVVGARLSGDDSLFISRDCGGRLFAAGEEWDNGVSVIGLFADDTGISGDTERFKDGEDLSGCDMAVERDMGGSGDHLFGGRAGDSVGAARLSDGEALSMDRGCGVGCDERSASCLATSPASIDATPPPAALLCCGADGLDCGV